eukprot:CAMPEP_0115841702 /NCGR_PEP_ID=MMETSP0287-20121206/7423_1 /TAXON_ID=412157 /ORGANISM="Chrysochromulina rotalis, Strain UIO044" /LENGTH=175 /DNA_ID=CAMNT_0003295353 /DNA_START=637 /DNA_END=1162 /DNA_ORIENTATION=-
MAKRSEQPPQKRPPHRRQWCLRLMNVNCEPHLMHSSEASFGFHSISWLGLRASARASASSLAFSSSTWLPCPEAEVSSDGRAVVISRRHDVGTDPVDPNVAHHRFLAAAAGPPPMLRENRMGFWAPNLHVIQSPRAVVRQNTTRCPPQAARMAPRDPACQLSQGHQGTAPHPMVD